MKLSETTGAPVNSLSSPNNNLIIVPLSSGNYRKAAHLYSDVFLADEPTSHRCALDPSIFLPYAEFYVRSLISKNLSLVAHDTISQEIIGFIFCVDLASDIRDEGEEMVQFLSHFKETVAMIDELEDRFLIRKNPPVGTILHIYQIGVERKYRNSGIAKALIHQTLDIGLKKGFQQVIADSTCLASIKSFESCGFHSAGMLPYESFQTDGNYFFSGLEGGISLMVKDIG